jgi:hypothetical protein
MIKPGQDKLALDYVRKIHNTEKRRYALAYKTFLIDGKNPPVDADFKCSYMAKQAVRLCLADILC